MDNSSFLQFRDIPIYHLQANAVGFNKIIRKTADFVKNSSESSENSLKASDTTDSEAVYLNSPTRNMSYQWIKVIPQISLSIPQQSNCFVHYRNFLGKAVKVFRRRAFDPINYQSLPDITLNTPKIQKTFVKSPTKIYADTMTFVRKKIQKKNNQSVPFFYPNQEKLDFLTSQIAQKKIQKNYLEKKLLHSTSFSPNSNFKKNCKKSTKTPILFKKAGLSNLPARKRYIKLNKFS